MLQKTYKPYKSIETLPMYNYYKVADTGELRYLLKNIDIDDLPDYKGNLNSLWEDISCQVADINIESNRSNQNVFDIRKKIAELELDYVRVKTILLGLRANKDDELLKELESLGYKFNDNKDYGKEWIRINKRSELLKTKIAIKKDELSSLTSKSNKKTNIESVVDDVERYLNKSIDMHKTSTKKWFIMLNKVIIDSNKKAAKNK